MNNNDKINKINDVIKHLCSVLEMRTEQGDSYSLSYDGDNLWNNKVEERVSNTNTKSDDNVDKEFEKNIKELTELNISKDIINIFKPLFKDNKKEIDKIAQNINKQNAALKKKLSKLNKDLIDLKKEQRELKNQQEDKNKKGTTTKKNTVKTENKSDNNQNITFSDGKTIFSKNTSVTGNYTFSNTKASEDIQGAINDKQILPTNVNSATPQVKPAVPQTGTVNSAGGNGNNGSSQLADTVSSTSPDFLSCASALTFIMKVFDWLVKAVVAVANYRTAKYESYTKVVESTYEYKISKINATTSKRVTNITEGGAITLKKIEVSGENMLDRLRIESMKYTKAQEIASSQMFEGISKSAYKAAETMLDVKGEMLKLGARQKMRSEQLEHQITASGVAIASASDRYDATVVTAQQRYEGSIATERFNQNILETERYIATELDDVFSDVGSFHSEINEYKRKGIPIEAQQISRYKKSTDNIFTTAGTIWREQALGSYDNEKASAQASLSFQINTDIRAIQLAAKQKEINANLKEQAAKMKQGVADAISSNIEQRAEILIDAEIRKDKAWLKFAENIENFVTNFDKQVNTAGLGLGLLKPERLYEYKMGMFDVAKELALKFNKNIEDLVNQQLSYTDSTKRNIMFTTNDYKNITALGKFIEDDNLAIEYASSMEIFNSGIESAVKSLGNMLGRAVNEGLNVKSLTKDIVNNMSLAEKYSFRGGTDGYLEFAKWAANSRVKLESIESMLDSFQHNSIDEMFVRSTEFQVLGGMARQNSDPWGMIFDLWTDVGSFAKRMNNMLIGVGNVNKITGEIDFTTPDNYYINQLAKLQYSTPEELKQRAIHFQKRKAIENFAKDNNLSNINESNLDFVTNKAYYDENAGTWVIVVEDDKGFFVPKPLSELTANDLQSRIPESLGDQIVSYLEKLVTISELNTGAETAMKTDLGQGTFDTVMEELRARTQKAHDTFIQQRQVYIDNAVQAMHAATEAYQGYIDEWKKGNTAIDEEVKRLEEIAKNLADELDKVAKDVADAEKELEGIGGVGGRTVAPDPIPREKKSNGYIKVTTKSLEVRAASRAIDKDYQEQLKHPTYINGKKIEPSRKTMGQLYREKGWWEADNISALVPEPVDRYNEEIFRQLNNGNSQGTQKVKDAIFNDSSLTLSKPSEISPSKPNKNYTTYESIKTNNNTSSKFSLSLNTDVEIDSSSVRWTNPTNNYLKVRTLSQHISNQMTKNEYGNKIMLFTDRYNR